MAKSPSATSKRKGWASSLAKMRQHVIVIGEVMHASSLVQDAFFRVFWVALILERREQWTAWVHFRDHALALWHTTNSDIQQREMAVVAFKSLPTKLDLRRVIDGLIWAQKRADIMLQYRNIVAHNPIMFSGAVVKGRLTSVPALGGYSVRPASKKKLGLIPGLQFWRTYRTDLLNLSEYIRAIYKHAQRIEAVACGADMVGVDRTLRGRPQLRSYSRLREIDRMSQRATVPAKQQRPRRSSRPKGRP
jgi:hypothetical protein